MALVQYYMDESGDVDTPSFVMGGYCAPVDTWMRFSDEWQAALDRAPSIPPLHMYQVEKLSDGFEVLDDGTAEQRARYKRLHALVSVLRKHKIIGRLVCWRNAAFNKHVRAQLPKRMRKLNTPHAVGCFTLLSRIGFSNPGLEQFGDGSLECIFDWHEQSGPSSRAEYENEVLPELQKDHPQFSALGVHWPRPEERWKHTPLQAADLLVWHVRRAMDYRDGKSRPIYKELMRATPIVRHNITATQMRRLIDAGYDRI